MLNKKKPEDKVKQFIICLFATAPKLRSSFSTIMVDNSKAVQRPNSIISLGSSFSSSTSRSSGSTSSSNSNTNTINTATLSMEFDMINESLPLSLKTENNTKKYQRSTTLVSQLSMGILLHLFHLKFYHISFLCVHSFSVVESGIIADISSSPDNEVQTSEETNTWSKSSTSFLQPHKTTTNTNHMSHKHKTLNENVTHKLQTIDSDDMNANATANPYINNDSIAVHL